MSIKTDSDIDAESAKALRLRLKLTQREFWSAAGASQSAGSQYEHGARAIPKAVKKLVFIQFEAGLRFDSSNVQAAQALRDIAAKAASTQG